MSPVPTICTTRGKAAPIGLSSRTGAAYPARMERLAPQVRKARKGRWALRGHRACKEYQGLRENQARQGQQALPGRTDHKESRGNRAFQASKAHKVRRGRKDPPVIWVRQDRPVLPESKARPGLQALTGLTDRKGLKGNRAFKGLKEHRGRRVRPVPPGNKGN